MEIAIPDHQVLAVFIARLFLGFLFFFQGYDVVFRIKIIKAIQTYQSTFYNKGMPKLLTTGAIWFTSCSALVGGTCLILGLFEYYTLYILGINLIITTIGFGINTPMWDTRFVFPRLILIIFLLLVPDTWNSWSMDNLLFP